MCSYVCPTGTVTDMRSSRPDLLSGCRSPVAFAEESEPGTSASRSDAGAAVRTDFVLTAPRTIPDYTGLLQTTFS